MVSQQEQVQIALLAPATTNMTLCQNVTAGDVLCSPGFEESRTKGQCSKSRCDG